MLYNFFALFAKYESTIGFNSLGIFIILIHLSTIMYYLFLFFSDALFIYS